MHACRQVGPLFRQGAGPAYGARIARMQDAALALGGPSRACSHYEIRPGGPPWYGGWSRCQLLQDIGVTRQAFQHDPRTPGRNFHRPASRLQPLHGRYTQ
jgi:hypothetical protein